MCKAVKKFYDNHFGIDKQIRKLEANRDGMAKISYYNDLKLQIHNLDKNIKISKDKINSFGSDRKSNNRIRKLQRKTRVNLAKTSFINSKNDIYQAREQRYKR